VEGEMNEQVKKNKPHYPTEPFVKKYERHVEKWGEILNDQENRNTRSLWNHSNGCVIFPLVIMYHVQRLLESLPFKQSSLPQDLPILLEEIQLHDDTRLLTQKLLFDSYVYIIENDEDCEWVEESDGDGGTYLKKQRWKEYLVKCIDRIDNSNNNPFDVLWYEGIRRRNASMCYRRMKVVFYTLVILIGLGFFFINNRKLLFGTP
jgi:hypothetical protein